MRTTTTNPGRRPRKCSGGSSRSRRASASRSSRSCRPGVYVGGKTLGSLFSDRIPLAIAAGLFFGKTIGVFGGAYLTARFTRAELSDELRWRTSRRCPR